MSQLTKKYKVVYLHNPKHFFLNSLYIEDLPNGQKLLCANPRPHSKQFHRLAILKPKVKPKQVEYFRPQTLIKEHNSEVFVKENTMELKKPFNGIFRD